MASPPGLVSGCKPENEVKTQFITREGLYKLLALPEYSRPNRVQYGAQIPNTGTHTGAAPPVRASFAKASPDARRDKIVFNIGREIFVYPFKGVRKAADLSKPLDKRIYKGTCPTCHDFGTTANLDASLLNTDTANQNGSDSPDLPTISPLLVGFSQGQIQLVDPVKKEFSKLYNEERLIDKTKVTCIKWIPGSPNLFLASFASGAMYVFNHGLSCAPSAPVYQTFKQGDGFSVFTCKAKSTRNPLYKWTVGHGSINQFSFSSCGQFLAVASQDGYLRIFNYNTMDLTGMAKSYFGGFNCVCWSPDGRYVACGGEDDLITVYSVAEDRVVVRGQGHKSWISQVAFDEFNMSYGDVPDGLDFSGSDEEGSISPNVVVNGRGPQNSKTFNESGRGSPPLVSCYRLGSVGEDAHLCLWDLTEDVLRKASLQFINSPTQSSAFRSSPGTNAISSSSTTAKSSSNESHSLGHAGSSSSSTHNSLTSRFASLNFKDKKSNSSKNHNTSNGSSDRTASTSSLASSSSGSNHSRHLEFVKLGSNQCPRINQVPLIEPLVCKRISQERLTSLHFLDDCFVTACQDGIISTWARPGRVSGTYSVNVMCPGSPPSVASATTGVTGSSSSAGSGGGTIV